MAKLEGDVKGCHGNVDGAHWGSAPFTLVDTVVLMCGHFGVLASKLSRCYQDFFPNIALY